MWCPTPEVPRTRFYEDHHKMAKEHDKEFVRRYDEDLDTTPISAVTSASIVEVNSQSQPDSIDEATAPLRIPIPQKNNVVFGDTFLQSHSDPTLHALSYRSGQCCTPALSLSPPRLGSDG